MVPGARSGRLTLDKYQREPIEQSFTPGIEGVSLMWSSQLGKSLVAACVILYHSAWRTGDIYAMFSCQDHRADFVNSRLTPIAQASPAIHEIIGRNRNNAIPGTGFTFGRGYCKMTTARSVGAGHSSTTRLIVNDELDDCNSYVPVSSLRQRGVTFLDRTVVLMSTPTHKGSSSIEKEYLAGSQAQFYLGCQICETTSHHVMALENISEGVYHCPECGSPWTEVNRIWAINTGQWVHTYPDKPHKSYQMSQLYSCSVPIARTWKDAEACESDYQRSTQIMAWPFEEVEIEPVQPGDIRRCPIPFERAHCTVGVDVQKNRLEWTAIVWSQFLIEKQIVARGIVLRTPGPEAMQDLRKQVAPLAPDRITIDGSYDYDWIRTNIDIVFSDAMLLPDPPVEIVRGYTAQSFDRPLRGSKGGRYFWGSSDEAKVLITRDLKIQSLTLSPSLPGDTEAQLMSERLVRTTIGERIKREWKHDVGVRNEVLDCSAYAYMGVLALNVLPSRSSSLEIAQ